ncbi:MAG: lipoate--protein ligase family protein [Gaiellales bacterium]
MISAGVLEPARALACDEALVRASALRPTLLLWRTSPAVVIGRFQRADWEVDAAACAAHGARVWRRFTGGGAVYLDGGTLCAALVAPPGDAPGMVGVPGIYAPLLEAIAAACRRVGVNALRDERTVRVGGRKVTGIAAHHGRGGTLVHGTVLVSADLTALEECIRGPRGGRPDGTPNPTASRPDTVTNVGADGLEAALAEELGAEPGAFEPAELEKAEELLRARYHDPAWHAGPWSGVTPPDVWAILGGVRSAERSD